MRKKSRYTMCCQSLAHFDSILRHPHKSFDLPNLRAPLPLAASHEFFDHVIGSEARLKGVVEGNCRVWAQMRHPTCDVALYGAVAVIAVDP